MESLYTYMPSFDDTAYLTAKIFLQWNEGEKKIKGGIAHLQINMLIKPVRALNSLKTNKQVYI